jgi:beta-xylosidase
MWSLFPTHRRLAMMVRTQIAAIIGLLALLAAGCGGAAPAVLVPPAITPLPPTATTAPPAATAAAPTTTAAGAVNPGEPAAPPGSFENPVLRSDFPDPFVLNANGTYYAYATNGSGKNIQTAQSPDLVHWTVGRDAMPALPKWAKLGGSYVWAPEVIANGSGYLMYYTARDKAADRQCVGVASGDKPDGFFKDTRDAALVCQTDEGGTIDPSPFRDGDKLYLYFKNDGNCCNKPTYLWVQELAPDGLSLVGQPTQLMRNDVPWEGTVVEAPTMVKHEDKYYLFFSANNYAGIEYSVGYATCDSPTGPCTQAAENPILKSHMTPPLVVGPGHQAIVQVKDQTWIVYHAWNILSSGVRGDARYLWIDRLDWEGGKPVVRGPTTDPQPMP